jgi:hypothetical protein
MDVYGKKNVKSHIDVTLSPLRHDLLQIVGRRRRRQEAA